MASDSGSRSVHIALGYLLYSPSYLPPMKLFSFSSVASKGRKRYESGRIASLECGLTFELM